MAKRTPARKKAKKQAKKSSKAKGKKAKPKKPTLAQNLATFRGDVKNDIAEVVTMADDDCVAHVRMWIPTGCLEIDRKLTPPALLASGRVGGFPCGRLIEIYGPAHIGKSTLLDHGFVSVQKMGGAAILIETDSGRDENYTGRIGVDMKALQYFQFGEDQASIENVTDEAITTIKWWKKNAPDTPVLLGFDALGVTPTQEEIKKKVSENTTASAAKVLRRACRKIAAVIAGTNIAFVILNHQYSQISFGGGPTGKKNYGGDAVTLLAAVRIQLHPVQKGWVKTGEDGVILGRKTGYNIEKFKLGNAYSKGEFAVISGSGIDNSWTLWNVLGDAGVIAKGGAWGAVNINGEVIKFQGWLKLRQKCIEDPEFYANMIDIYWQTLRAQNVT